MPRKVRLTRIISRAGEVAYQLSNLQFSEFHPTPGWTPDINAYRFDDRIEIWVDLAGVEKDEIRVEILPLSVRLSGERQTPVPACENCRQVLAMEIQNGRFARQIQLSDPVDPERVTARHENGLLHIQLPLALG
ncbi:MAG: Hsp20/alpha crystallin family protein [Verrucomicrobiae bacterium]|nr:Hsp20/alpha crystallin family protein [Verrucomicrobiae bacterium]MCP5540885.1 Hsp20/alpha crystallin family protein [Akkermansiaceae bacterium]MCP5550371.1 Hsp20/alpha crystallin family protein [Akkermansiaceae bacterium]